MKLTFLGTGTSFGVPKVGCYCDVCRSPDPRDTRNRVGAVVESNRGTRLLIDTPPELRLQLIAAGIDRVDAVAFTHEHADHVVGLVQLSTKLHIPVYCNRPTQDAFEGAYGVSLDCRLFRTRDSFEIGDVVVETFDIPHDAQDPVGFLLRTPAGNVGILTDLGHTTRHVLDRVRAANVLVIEANHDIKMLQDCPHRPWSLKQRILSRHGHLSNEAAAQEISVKPLRTPGEQRRLALADIATALAATNL